LNKGAKRKREGALSYLNESKTLVSKRRGEKGKGGRKEEKGTTVLHQGESVEEKSVDRGKRKKERGLSDDKRESQRGRAIDKER